MDPENEEGDFGFHLIPDAEEPDLACEPQPENADSVEVRMFITPVEIEGFVTQMPMHMIYEEPMHMIDEEPMHMIDEEPMHETPDDTPMLTNELYFEHTA